MIVTVSREFGSGGRELGKRLSEQLGIPCYDREIIDMIAKEGGFDPEQVRQFSEKRLATVYPRTIAHRFAARHGAAARQAQQISAQQQKLIEQLGAGGDCLIVGRGANVLLAQYHPFNLFVYADEVSKLRRCQRHATEDEDLTPVEMLRKMKEIDKERAHFYAAYSSARWDDPKNYHLCVNTSNRTIKELAPVLADYIRVWFACESD